MKWDPYTLVVVLGKDGKSEGSLYVDDGENFYFHNGAYIHRKFVFSGTSLSSENVGTKLQDSGLSQDDD